MSSSKRRFCQHGRHPKIGITNFGCKNILKTLKHLCFVICVDDCHKLAHLIQSHLGDQVRADKNVACLNSRLLELPKLTCSSVPSCLPLEVSLNPFIIPHELLYDLLTVPIYFYFFIKNRSRCKIVILNAYCMNFFVEFDKMFGTYGNVKLNSSLWVQCGSNQGYKAKYSLLKKPLLGSGSYQKVQSRIKVWTSGLYYISSLTPADEGYYKCRASLNGVTIEKELDRVIWFSPTL